MTEPVLDRASINEALRLLGERLAYRGVVADLYVFDGARWHSPTTSGGRPGTSAR